MAHFVNCVYCGDRFDRDKELFTEVSSRRYAHRECFDNHVPEDDDYIDKIYEVLNDYQIKYKYMECNRQRLHYVQKLGYTNEGIFNSLKYFYGVKKGDPIAAEGRIGIVPYVYDEAQAYYKNLQKKQKEIARDIKKQLKEKPKIIHVKEIERKNPKGLIDLTKIGGED